MCQGYGPRASRRGDAPYPHLLLYNIAAYRDIVKYNDDNTAKKIIITNDDIDYSTSTVYHYKLRDFLLMDEL